MEVKIEREGEYTLYALVGIVYAVLYLTAAVFVALVSKDSLPPHIGDYVNGALLSGVFFGMPVIIFIGVVAIINAKVERKKGKFFGIIAIVAPIIFFISLLHFWYPLTSDFWTYSFSSARGINAVLR